MYTKISKPTNLQFTRIAESNIIIGDTVCEFRGH